MTKVFASVYLAAMIDGEGCVSISRNKGEVQRSVSIANTDEDILAAIRCAFDTLGISYWQSQRKDGLWTIGVAGGRESFKKVFALVPIQSERKKAKLIDILGSYTRARNGVGTARRGRSKNPWRARIQINGVQHWLGSFATEAEAIKAVKQARRELLHV